MKKAFSLFALSAILFVSLIGVCTQLSMACGLNCSEQTMGVLHGGDQLMGCAQDGSACLSSMTDHMTLFASMYPSVAPSTALLLLVIGAVLLVARFFFSQAAQDDLFERSRIRLKSLRWRLSNSVSPDFLVFAFSRGILNSKIHA